MAVNKNKEYLIAHLIAKSLAVLKSRDTGLPGNTGQAISALFLGFRKKQP